MKKIAFVLPDLSGGGAENRTLCLAKTLAALNHDVHLFLLANKIDHQIPDGVQVHLLPPAKTLRFRRYRTFAKSLKAQLALLESDTPFDLIIGILFDAHRVLHHLDHPNTYYSIRNTLSLTLAALAKRSWFKKIKRYYDYHRLYTAKPLITVSQAIADDLIAPLKIRPLNIKTLYNPFDFTQIKQLSNENIALPDYPYILHVGRFAAQKRHDLLFGAVAKLPATHKLVLLTKPCEALSTLIAEHQLQDRIILPGFQKNPYPWFKHASLLVLCSDREGLPGVLIEALACGTPVISTNCPGPNEILTNDLADALIPCDDVSALTAKIQQYLKTPPSLADTYLERFEAEKAARCYLDLI